MSQHDDISSEVLDGESIDSQEDQKHPRKVTKKYIEDNRFNLLNHKAYMLFEIALSAFYFVLMLMAAFNYEEEDLKVARSMRLERLLIIVFIVDFLLKLFFNIQ